MLFISLAINKLILSLNWLTSQVSINCFVCCEPFRTPYDLFRRPWGRVDPVIKNPYADQRSVTWYKRVVFVLFKFCDATKTYIEQYNIVVV